MQPQHATAPWASAAAATSAATATIAKHRAVDVQDLNPARILEVVSLTCTVCGQDFQFAVLGPGRLPGYCADCATLRHCESRRRIEKRKELRRRADPRCTRKRDLDDLARTAGHHPVTVGRVVSCAVCYEALGRRRGPAKSTVWFRENAATVACPGPHQTRLPPVQHPQHLAGRV